MKPNIVVQLREDAGRRRRCRPSSAASTSWAWPSRSSRGPARRRPDHRPAAGRDRTSQRAKDIIRSTALLELKLVEDGPASTKEPLLQARNGVAAGQHGGRARRRATRRAAGDRAETVYYLVRKVAVGDRPRPAQRQAVARRDQPAGGQLLAEPRTGARKFGKATGENIGRHLAIVLDGRVQSAPVIERRISDEGRISRHLHAAGGPGPVARAAVGRAAGVADLPRGAHRRPVARRRLDPVRRDCASLVGLALVMLFMLFYYKLSGINAIVVDGHQPDRSCSA